MLINDDSTLDKPYARAMELVTRHWSGKHHRVVRGINLSTLLWTDGDGLVPTDLRVYDKADGLTKNELKDYDPLWAMLGTARARFVCFVCFDSWYSSLENLKVVRGYLWRWLTRLKGNRLVNPDEWGNVGVSEVDIPTEGRVVHLKGYGMIRVLRTVAPDGDAEHWATDDLQMSEAAREELALQCWGIEEYHRGIKQCCGIERCQVRSGRGQRAFLRLEAHRLDTGGSWYEAKIDIIRDAIRRYLAQPRYRLSSTA